MIPGDLDYLTSHEGQGLSGALRGSWAANNILCLLNDLSRRSPLIDKHIPWTRQHAGLPLEIVAISRLPDVTALVPIPDNFPSQYGVSRPIIKRHGFERTVVYVMVKHSIRELERSHFTLWIPNAQIGVLAREDHALAGKTIELGGVGAAGTHKVLNADMAIYNAFE